MGFWEQSWKDIDLARVEAYTEGFNFKGDLMKVVWMKFKEDDSKQREENEDWRVC